MPAPEIDKIVFPSIRIEQPIGAFYVGVLNHDDLISISWSDVQRLGERDVEEFAGIERPLDPTRVKDLETYVNTVDATFPTGVILAVSSDDADYDEKNANLSITRDKEVAKILDGQHRIAGLKAFRGERFQVNTIVFIDMDIEDQAMVFATINIKQTKVSKSLAYNLYQYATTRSPQKTAHDVTKLLNKRKGSPFQDRIKILGTATPGKEGETLTQAAFVERMLDLISDNPDEDRNIIKRGKSPKRADDLQSRKLAFRNMFLDGDRDAEIAKSLWNYFEAVSTRWPQAWGDTEAGAILNRTTGFTALMRLFPVAHVSIAAPGEMVSTDDYLEVFRRIALSDEDFNRNRYVPGGTGPKDLYEDMLAHLRGGSDTPLTPST